MEKYLLSLNWPGRKTQITEIWETESERIGFNDMRVILGAPSDPNISLFDLISENSMRLLLGCPIRLGCSPKSADIYDIDENRKLRQIILNNNNLLFNAIKSNKTSTK